MNDILTHGALCNRQEGAPTGSLDLTLAASQAGINTIWTCETDPFCRQSLTAAPNSHLPRVVHYPDIYEVSHPPRPDILSAAYPSELAPNAQGQGQRRTNTYRWAWPQVRRLLTECRPTWFIGEHVAGPHSLEFDGVLSDLAGEDYHAWPLVVPASIRAPLPGMPPPRGRVWIIAHTPDCPASPSTHVGEAGLIEQSNSPLPDPTQWFRDQLRAAGQGPASPQLPPVPALLFRFIADYEAGLIR